MTAGWGDPAVTSGWGVPGSPTYVTPLAHWWRPDCRPACDPSASVRFANPNPMPDTDLALDQICPDCLVVVIEARRVLGGGPGDT